MTNFKNISYYDFYHQGRVFTKSGFLKMTLLRTF